MNRRDFFSRLSVGLAGIAAACGMLPELVKAEVPATVIPLKVRRGVGMASIPDTSSGRYEDWYDGPPIESEALHSISDVHAREWGAYDRRVPPGHWFLYDPKCLRKLELGYVRGLAES